MNLFFYILTGICLAYCVIQLVYTAILYVMRSKPRDANQTLPKISILIAARNEANNIARCLRSLNKLDYPEDKLEILIGNDHSTDYTRMIVENYIADKPVFRLINLDGTEHPGTKGKARVLATLADQASGEYYLITDADISVPPKWAKSMIGSMMRDGSDMCGGITNISAHRMIEKFQQVDWMYFMGLIHAFARIGKPLTVVGNNMAVSRKAYEACGGYGNIPFSITEDYALFKAVKAKGFKVSYRMSPNSMVYSTPIKNIRGILKQRKRWLTGGWDLPLHYHIMIAIFGAWYFALPVLFFMNWKLALSFMLFKDLLQLLQLLRINRMLKIKTEHPLAVLFYDLYLLILVPMTSIFFFMPGGNSWKGRRY